MGRGAYRPYFVRASQVLLCDMLQRRAKREVVCVCVCSPTKSMPGSPSPCRAVTSGISGMKARLSVGLVLRMVGQ